ncbi:helix-turn-helix domain-containing protein [Nonomuraea polychroma]|uniref:helix-turn-helix domain-containing protein n=1 Tax=Nonomuraea polychroma TaxID=46176 RepID=UPI003D8F6118
MAAGDPLYTAAEAAAEVGVERDTIYTWVRRGFLKHKDRRGRLKLFDLDDVFQCEANRQHEHRRKS